jgi:hypothetical protein
MLATIMPLVQNKTLTNVQNNKQIFFNMMTQIFLKFEKILVVD